MRGLQAILSVFQLDTGNISPREIYRFYPMWVDRMGGARYAQVTVSLGSTLGEGAQAKQLQLATIGAAQWKTAPATIDLQRFKGRLPQMRETIRLNERERERR